MPVMRPTRRTTYGVRKGDTWSILAKRFNLKIEDLLSANSDVPNQLAPGTVIRVPEGTGNRIPSTLTSNYAGMSPSPATIQNRTSNAFNVPAATGPFPAATGPFPAPYSYPRSVRYDVPQQGPLASTAPMPGQREQYLNIWAAAQQGQMFPSIPEWYRVWRDQLLSNQGGFAPENLLQQGYVLNPVTGIWTQTNPQTATNYTAGYGVGGRYQEPAWWERGVMQSYGYYNTPTGWAGGGGGATYRTLFPRKGQKGLNVKPLRRFPEYSRPNSTPRLGSTSPTGRMSDYATIGLVTWRI